MSSSYRHGEPQTTVVEKWGAIFIGNRADVCLADSCRERSIYLIDDDLQILWQSLDHEQNNLHFFVVDFLARDCVT